MNDSMNVSAGELEPVLAGDFRLLIRVATECAMSSKLDRLCYDDGFFLVDWHEGRVQARLRVSQVSDGTFWGSFTLHYRLPVLIRGQHRSAFRVFDFEPDYDAVNELWMALMMQWRLRKGACDG